MPTVREVEQALYALAPRDLAQSWDNVGLLVGEPEQEVRQVLVALDVTQAVAEEALSLGCGLIVAHHPLMNCAWSPVQSVRTDQPQGKLITTLIRGGVSAICMHTNLDSAAGGVNDALAAALGLEDVGPLGEDGIGRTGVLERETPLEAFAAYVKDRLQAGDLLLDLLVLLAKRQHLEVGQPLQAHVEDRLRLNLGQPKARYQLLARLFRRLASADELDDLA